MSIKEIRHTIMKKWYGYWTLYWLKATCRAKGIANDERLSLRVRCNAKVLSKQCKEKWWQYHQKWWTYDLSDDTAKLITEVLNKHKEEFGL